MKTFKKALSIILGAAIMLSCLFGMQVSVAAEGTLALSVGNATAADGTVTVPVSVDTNSGFRALGIEVSYDAEVLELTAATKTTFVADVNEVGACSETLDVNPYVMQWAYVTDENVTAKGTIANLTFKVLDASAETTEVSVEVTEAWDANKDAVDATATAGTVDLVEEPAGPVEIVTQYNRTLAFESQINVNLYAAQTTELLAYGNANIHLAVWKNGDESTKQILNVAGTRPNTPFVVDGSQVAKTAYVFTYTGLAAAELGDTFEFYVYAVDDNGEVACVANTSEDKATNYLKEQLVKATGANVRTALFADVANYAAAAQTNFNYKTDKLVNSEAFDAQFAALIEQYDTDSTPETKAIALNSGDGIVMQYSVQFVSKMEFNLHIPKQALNTLLDEKGKTLNDTEFVVTYLNGTKKTFAYSNEAYSANANYYIVTFAELVAAQMREVCSVDFYVAGEKVTNTLDFGMSGYAHQRVINYNNAPTNVAYKNIMNLALAALNYSDSAAAFFS